MFCRLAEEAGERELVMLIADSQVHIWLDNSPERPWAGGKAHQQGALTAERLFSAMNEAGVDRAILVPPECA